MKTLEKTYTLFSPAAGGREKPVGEIDAVVSRVSAAEEQTDGVSRSRESAVACTAANADVRRGMSIRRGGERWDVLGASRGGRMTVLRLERTVMDGEV